MAAHERPRTSICWSTPLRKVARLKRALRVLEDQAIDEVADTDIARYTG
jgi:hypothetical protein